MQDREPNRRPRHTRTGLFLSLTALTFVVAALVLAASWESYRRRTQMQNDPRVARVWVAGTTFGAHHQLQRGASLQRWLNERHISVLGDYEVVQSQYANDRGSMEIWFNYESYLIGQPDLECHRVDPAGTAFVDDLGQPYHGFLDIHGKTVGVYLPGYDHAAREMRCVLHWMPRRPADPSPDSRPMAFTVKLPRLPRILPPAAGLPRAVTVQNQGITATVEAVRLGPPRLATGDVGQRDLTFHLKIDGGELANDNVASDLGLNIPDPVQAARLRRIIGAAPRPPLVAGRSPLSALQAQRQMLAFTNATYDMPMTLTDPYGLPLIVPGQSVTPLVSKDVLQNARRGKGMVWVVPVRNAGKGTDVVRFHFNVAPTVRPDRFASSAPIAFDLDVRVQTGDEI